MTDKTAGKTLTLNDLPDIQIRKMTSAQLVKLCAAAGVSTEAAHAELVARILARKHIDGKTLCPMCKTGVIKAQRGGDSIRKWRCTNCGYQPRFATT